MDRLTIRHQYFAALALACLLSAAWAIGDWSNLAARALSDTDDVMRLQQVRDWLAGQAFADVSQHRLAGGLAMHWSRIGDLVPAAIIVAMRPLIGTAGAEIAAIIGWPLMQFAALLSLIVSITRTIAPRAVATALVMAALAYPAITLFVPGRVDHHGLQLLLVLVQLRALLAVPSLSSGALAGAAAAAGAAIGLETAPFAVVTAAVMVLGWFRGDGQRLTGFGIALAISLFALLPLSAHGGVCDTVGPLVTPVIVGGLALAALGRCTRFRLPLLLATGAALTMFAWPALRPCLSGPYGTVDPMVARLWLANVSEAKSLFAVSLGEAIGSAGLVFVGLAASGWLAWRQDRVWWLVFAYQAVSAAITLAQLRGAYIGAALAVLPLASMLTAARQRGRSGLVLALWVAGTGISYPLLTRLLTPQEASAATGGCTRNAVLTRLNALPVGRVMAGIDAGAFIV
ncbi:MAG: hypothetical protein EOO24_42845, partial [Comamonadaceae bacterium]